MSVAVRPGEQFAFDPPTVVLKNVNSPDDSVGRTNDVALDGRRFLFIRNKPGETPAAGGLGISVVLNWGSELTQAGQASR